MQVLMDVLQKTKAFFESKGIDNARLEAELLFAHVLNCPRLELYLQFERPLDDATISRLRKLVKRRSAREPLQYVLGETPFRELKLKVDDRVLIPRPETEYFIDLIAEHVLQVPESILDLGTGSGAIALSLATMFSDAAVTAVDQSEDSLSVVKENAQGCGLKDRVECMQSDWLDNVEGTFDLIVSNPPYLTEAEWGEAQPEVKLFEPRRALVAGNDGMSDLEVIMRDAPSYLAESGMLALETGIAHHSKLKLLADQVGYARTLSLKDDSKRERFFFAWV